MQGHYAIMFANALGSEVTAFTRQESKVSDAKKMGAAHVVVTHGTDFADALQYEFDLIVSTADANDKFPLEKYMRCGSVAVTYSARR
jgi:alcohol dehydrogenase (NADP+)